MIGRCAIVACHRIRFGRRTRLPFHLTEFLCWRCLVGRAAYLSQFDQWIHDAVEFAASSTATTETPEED